MKNNSRSIGIVLILIAVMMMATATGIMPNIPWFRIIISCLFIGWAVKGLLEREFCGALICACVPAWLFEDYLGIEDLVPFPLCIAAVLCGIGLDMVIGKKTKAKTNEDVPVNETPDGRHVALENNFASVSKYVNAAAFRSAKLENNFGAANIYFNNATIANGEAKVELENNFGQMNIYIPSTWRANITQDTAFGSISVFGEPNRDMDAPLVIISANCNFGSLNIYFE